MKPEAYAEEMQTLLGDRLADIVLTHYKPETIRKLITETNAGNILLNVLETLGATRHQKYRP